MEPIFMVIDGDLHQFRVLVTDRSDHHVSGQVERVTAWEDNIPAQFEEYLAFFMKWDECCHINFGSKEMPGYLHLCDEHDWIIHAQLMIELFAWAKAFIPMTL